MLVRFFTLVFVCILTPSLFAFHSVDQHTDFLPQYESQNENLLLSQIDYTRSKTILHLRYITAKDKETLRFGGQDEPQRFKIMAVDGSAQKWDVKVTNVRTDNQLQISEVPNDLQVQYHPRKGTILSFEIHFDRLPQNIDKISLLGGTRDEQKQAKFESRNIHIKNAESKQLGEAHNMTERVKNFYSKFRYIRSPKLYNITSLEVDQKFEVEKETAKTANKKTQIQGTMNAVDYMPEFIDGTASSSDLKCRERMILKDLQFRDNKAEFVNKNQANKTIQLLADYLKKHPENKLTLHGHTDVFGDQYVNLLLSKDRVVLVKEMLTNRGIDKSRIVTLYHGGEQPLPTYKQGGELNRRVEIEVLCTHR